MVRVDASGNIPQVIDTMRLEQDVLYVAFEFFGCVQVSRHDDGCGFLEALVGLDLMKKVHTGNVG